jgi:hypothetical protein
MTAQKSSRSATGSSTSPARAETETEAGAKNQPESAPAVPAPLTPEALRRLRARLARKYH